MNPHFGKLVRCDANALGVGKIIDSDRTTVLIEYFNSPVASERPTERVPWPQVRRVKKLEEQTRVYFHDQKAGYWRIGRVQLHVENGDIFVQLPNHVQARVVEKDIFVRWNRPLPDPWEHLAARLTETPYFHSGRSRLIRHFVAQRAAAGGMTALLSAPVEIEPHQVEVVRRVLQDPVQRYLLADEVGLGKTIEAGLIVRQHILDHPLEHRVLIIVPGGLVEQWIDELRLRCQLAADLGHSLQVVPLETIAAWRGDQPTFVVVDEAHQAVSGWNENPESPNRMRFEAVRRWSAPGVCPQLLLLSATPIRRNESGFFALLHLLDPAVYDLRNQAAFQERVEKRQEIADIFAAFIEDQQSFFLESTTEQLASMFPNDHRLQQMLAEFRPFLSEESNESERRTRIRAIRTHLSDTYRLHRRMLRNRRNEEIAGLLTGRRGLSRLVTDDSGINQAEALLEAWRARAAAAAWDDKTGNRGKDLAQLFSYLLEANWGDLDALAYCIEVRRARAVEKKENRFGVLADPMRLEALATIPIFDGELEIWDEFDGRLTALRAAQRARCARIANVLSDLRQRQLRVVCMTTSPAFADQLFKVLAAKWPGNVVARHGSSGGNWRTVWETVAGAVLVCDARAEEGVNLQGKQSGILHLDLPLAPNRVEQRVGRVDRYGVGRTVESFVLVENDASFATKWTECLDVGWGVFRRSIAALQYLVEDEMKSMLRAMLVDGLSALVSLTDRLKASDGVLEKELRSIRNQDELDALELPSAGMEHDVVARLEANDAEADAFQASFDDWLVGRLQFIRVGEKSPADKVMRYHYRYTGKGALTLMPQQEVVRWIGPAFDPQPHHPEFGPPLTRVLSFSRQTAIHRGVALGRLGHPLVDGVYEYLQNDDRGTCFAFWRQTTSVKLDEIKLFFRFDLVVETNLSTKQLDLGMTGSRAVHRRADEAFPPLMETVWIDQDFLVPADSLVDELDEGFMREVDVNLNQERWQQAMERLGPCNWSELCASAREAAEKTLRQRRTLDALIRDAHAAFLSTVALGREQMLSRIEALSGVQAEQEQLRNEMRREDIIASVIAEGIVAPQVRLDSAGVVFLAASALR